MKSWRERRAGRLLHHGSPWFTLAILALAILGLRRLLRDEPGVTGGTRAEAPGREGAHPSPAAAVETIKAQAAGTPGASAKTMGARAVDPGGRPIADVLARMGEQTATSGPDGIFILPRASGSLLVTHPDFFPRHVESPRLLSFPPAAGTADRPAEEPPELLLFPGGRVRGKVMRLVAGGGKQALAGATLVFQQGETRLEAVSGNDGAYESPLLRAAAVSVFVTHPDCRPAGWSLPVVDPFAPREREVVLSPGERLAVKVTDRAGVPVAEAEVWLRSAPDPAATAATAPVAGQPPPLEEWEFLGWTGDLGTLGACRASGGLPWLEARAVGYRTEGRPLAGGEAHFRLARSPALEGRVVDAASGLPAQILAVRLERRAGEVAGNSGHSDPEDLFVPAPHRGVLTHSLGRGKLLLALPPERGTYRIAVLAAGSLHGGSEPFSFDGRTPPAEPIVIRLERQLELGGVVFFPGEAAAHRDLEGRWVEVRKLPAPGRLSSADPPPPGSAFPRLEPAAAATSIPGEGGATPALRSSIDPDGKFLFTGLAAGVYVVRVATPGHGEYISPPIDLAAGSALEDLPVRLHEGRRLSGRMLTVDDRPAAQVALRLERGPAFARRTTTDADGRFEFQDVAPGEAYAIAVETASGRRIVQRVDVPEGRDVFVQLRGDGAPRGGEP